MKLRDFPGLGVDFQAKSVGVGLRKNWKFFSKVRKWPKMARNGLKRLKMMFKDDLEQFETLLKN